MSERFRMALLGGFELSDASGAPLKLSTRKAQGLLAYLASRAGVECERDVLAGLFWGNRDDDHARNSLRQTLFLLRRVTAPTQPQLLNITTHTVSVDPAAVEIDVQAFDRWSRAGDPEALQLAAEVYRGDLLDGFTVNEAPFEEWLLQERERLREVAVDVLGRLLQWQRGQDRLDGAIRAARRLLVLEPWQEPVHRTLMRLLVQVGQPAAALRHYQQCEETLRRELGVDPEAETRTLFESIRSRPRTVDTARVAASAREADAAPDGVANGPVDRRPVGEPIGVALRALQVELSRKMVALSRNCLNMAGASLANSRVRLGLPVEAEAGPAVALDGLRSGPILDRPSPE